MKNELKQSTKILTFSPLTVEGRAKHSHVETRTHTFGIFYSNGLFDVFAIAPAVKSRLGNEGFVFLLVKGTQEQKLGESALENFAY